MGWRKSTLSWDILVLVKLDSDAAVKASGRHWYSTGKEVERSYGERERRLGRISVRLTASLIARGSSSRGNIYFIVVFIVEG